MKGSFLRRWLIFNAIVYPPYVVGLFIGIYLSYDFFVGIAIAGTVTLGFGLAALSLDKYYDYKNG